MFNPSSFGVPLDRQPTAYCPGCFQPYYRQDVGEDCDCGCEIILNEEKAEAEEEE